MQLAARDEHINDNGGGISVPLEILNIFDRPGYSGNTEAGNIAQKWYKDELYSKRRRFLYSFRQASTQPSRIQI
jgi:hypothetical protein